MKYAYGVSDVMPGGRKVDISTAIFSFWRLWLRRGESDMALARRQLQAIQEKIGISFRDVRLLELAFRHRSFRGERDVWEGKNSYERLEFLGDKTLGFLLAKHLYQKLPDADEGVLTQVFGFVASNEALADISERFGFQEFVLVGRGMYRQFHEERRLRSYMLACVFEAVIGAIVLDRGIGLAELFLESVLFPGIDEVVAEKRYINEKSLLNDLCQREFGMAPAYEVFAEKDLQGERSFLARVFLDNRCIGEGRGIDGRLASREAAKAALLVQDAIRGILYPENGR